MPQRLERKDIAGGLRAFRPKETALQGIQQLGVAKVSQNRMERDTRSSNTTKKKHTLKKDSNQNIGIHVANQNIHDGAQKRRLNAHGPASKKGKRQSLGQKCGRGHERAEDKIQILIDQV